ncbi:MAG: hypothetical protein Q9N34_06220 [Aquificota bacterium]|nr:hypothetical protein [Aquificota bacterium]
MLLLVPKHGYSYLYCPRCEAGRVSCRTFLTHSLKEEAYLLHELLLQAGGADLSRVWLLEKPAQGERALEVVRG